MSDAQPYSPQFLREEAERYFKLAQSFSDTADRETVMAYCRELLERARRMDCAVDKLTGSSGRPDTDWTARRVGDFRPCPSAPSDWPRSPEPV